MAVRDQLLDTADRLFYAEGINATGVDKISAHAGVGKMSLYKHFGSKDGLITAYLTERDRNWREHLSQRIALAPPDPAARLHAVVAAYEERIADPGYRGCSFMKAAAELPSGHPGWEVLADHKRRVGDQLRRDFAAARVHDAEVHAAHLFTLLEGLLAVAAVEPHDPLVTHARRAAHRLIDQVVRAAPHT